MDSGRGVPLGVQKTTSRLTDLSLKNGVDGPSNASALSVNKAAEMNMNQFSETTLPQSSCKKGQHVERIGPHGKKTSVYQVCFLGRSVLDKRYTQNMLPWIMAEMKRHCHRHGEMRMVNLHLDLHLHTLRAAAVGQHSEEDDCLFEHKLQNITRFARAHSDHTVFAYLMRTSADKPFTCYVFQALEEHLVPELFTAIREATKEVVKDIHHQQHSKEGRPVDNMGELMRSGCQFYEVLYSGKLSVAQKKAPASFIDETVLMFKQKESERSQRLAQEKEQRQRHSSGTSIHSLPVNLENSVQVKENELSSQAQKLRGNSTDSTGSSNSGDVFLTSSSSAENSQDRLAKHVSSSDDSLKDSSATETQSLVNHTASDDKHHKDSKNLMKSVLIGQSHLPTPGEHNRTMLFQIAFDEICLISPDKKTVSLERKFKDISFVSQGVREVDHFGFISREPCGGFMCYVFRCAAESVVDEIMKNLKRSFHNAFQQSAKNHVVCEQCPMHQLHKLCQQVEGLLPQKAFALIYSRVDALPEVEREDIIAKFKAEDPSGYQEMNEVLMMLLRQLCEVKQREHVHISDTGKSGGGGGGVKQEFNLVDNKNKARFELEMFKSKAKKSLASSFDILIRNKLKAPPEQPANGRERSWTSLDLDSSGATSTPDSSVSSTPDTTPCSSPMTKEFKDLPWAGGDSPRGSAASQRRPRSSTVGANLTAEQQTELKTLHTSMHGKKDHQECVKVSTPRRRSMFHHAQQQGSQSTTQSQDSHGAGEPQTPKTPIQRRGSWRQAIFHSVVTPTSKSSRKSIHVDTIDENAILEDEATQKKKSSSAIRALWKKAIMETLLLIRMEKENRNLQARQDAVQDKRQRLDYKEITPCLKAVSKEWESMLGTMEQMTGDKFDADQLLDAVKRGIPRPKRGAIWRLLVAQHRLHHPGVLKMKFPNVELETPYQDLLRQLTTHQHAILIDLGRTFPTHEYFTTPLGVGQLSLFNLLKAYSLLDTEVGYCQGLSFVAGILLMHMPEEEAFDTLIYMMFYMGFRRQYRPDMTSLQIQMYQLQRLLHDHYKELYEHFEENEIHPTLYAAPWFLTLFASQFPLGFVARVFDLIFLQGMEVIFKVALVLLGSHKELVLQCSSFETIVECLKTTLPEMSMIQMERVINQVFNLDISQQLNSYEVEYHVLQEEMLWSPQQGNMDIERLEQANQSLKRQNMQMLEQLQTAHNQNHTLEVTLGNLQGSHNRLKSHLKTLELERTALLNTVAKLKALIPPEKISQAGISLPDLMQNIPHTLHSGQDGNKNNFEGGTYDDSDTEVAIITKEKQDQSRKRFSSGESVPRLGNLMHRSPRGKSPLVLHEEKSQQRPDSH
ncbi:TBC1 domain family member 1 isoform X2 [Lingula anatina]|uniref:TBC1 domain family member 4 n=1 Tax=Lingula anatina TaxID=7574 RepID=A0A1S3K5F5_LINAN|nr:TBC1 domain family member 1 isoform X2 [Lingula anatina]|eukprot:XP_013417491.1 TBC1 domain family member 1 isoform X2 [Lingula anatina]